MSLELQKQELVLGQTRLLRVSLDVRYGGSRLMSIIGPNSNLIRIRVVINHDCPPA